MSTSNIEDNISIQLFQERLDIINDRLNGLVYLIVFLCDSLVGFPGLLQGFAHGTNMVDSVIKINVEISQVIFIG